jgi:hypothetical protein
MKCFKTYLWSEFVDYDKEEEDDDEDEEDEIVRTHQNEQNHQV